jgi:6-phosphogluconolactonase
MTYALRADGALEKAGETALPPGSGPRHLTVARDGSAVFVVNELSSTVQSFRRSADGALHPVSSCPAVPRGTTGNHCADIQLSPDGRFVYASNRGHDSIAIFAVGEGAALEPMAYVATGGATPRSFAITPTGRHLIVGNQNSDEIAVFARNAADGSLTDTGQRAGVGTPMCIRVEEMP